MADTLHALAPEPVVTGTLTAASVAFTTPVPGDGTFVQVSNNAGSGTAGVQLFNSAFVGTVDFEGTVDGINWFGLSPVNDQSIEPARSISAPGSLFYQLDIAGLTSFLIRCTAFTSGSLSVAVATSGPLPSGEPFAGAITTTVVSTGSRTASLNSPAQRPRNARTMTLFVIIQDASGGGSVTPSLQIEESNTTGHWITVWTAAVPLTVNGDYVYRFEAGASGGSWTEIAFFGVPARLIRWRMVHNNASPITYLAAQDLTF